MANPWDNDPSVSPVDIALAAENASPQVAGLAKSIYGQESGSGKNTTTSNAGAEGGMQVIPSTFNSVADPGWDHKDPVDNARAGVRYAAQMLNKANGDPAIAAAGYYGGPGALAKAQQGIAVSDPRNPNAPNTLQYGAQVAARIPQGASGGNPWDNDATVDPSTIPQGGSANPGAPTPAQQPPQPPQAGAGVPATPPQAAPAAPPAAPPESMWDKVLNFGSSLDPEALGQKMGAAFGNTVSGAAKQASTQPVLDTVANAARGGVAGISLGYSDKALAKFNSLTNGTNYDDEIAKQRAATAATGDVGKLAGDVAPFLLGGGAAGAAADLLPTASTALRAGAGMVAGGAEGAGSYLGNNDGPVDPKQLAISTGLGATMGAIPGLTTEASNAQKAATFLRANGGAASADTPVLTKLRNYVTGSGTDDQIANATRSADVIGDLSGLQNRATQQGVPLGASDANALAASYTQRATSAIRDLAPADQQPLINAMNQSKAMSDPEIAALRTTPQGNAVADAIQMRQQTQAMTAPTVANGNPVLKVGRMVVNNGGLGMLTPHSAILGAVTDLAPVRNVITNLLGGRENRAANIAKALGQSDNAAGFTAQYGPSAASQSAQDLQQMAQQAVQSRQAQQTVQAQQAASQNNLANSVAIRQQQAQARQAATQQSQGLQAAQAAQAQATSSGNLANSVAVRQQQAQARQASAQQAQQGAQQDALAQQAQQAQAAQRQQQWITQRQAQSQANQQAQGAAQGVQQAQAQAQQTVEAQAQQAAQARLAARVAARQQQLQAAAPSVSARQAAEHAALGAKVASGDFTGATLQKPALAAMMQHNGAGSVEAIQPTLQKLAASDPAMAQRIGQLLTPGSRNLKDPDYYAINDALKAAHGPAVPPAVVPQSSPALSEALGNVQNPLSYKAGITARQNAQKANLAQATDPDVKKLITVMSTTPKVADRAALFNKSMSGMSAEQQIEAKRLAEPLITYGK